VNARSPDELLAPALELARAARLYPSVIVHGGAEGDRRSAAARLGATLLCDAESAQRPCGRCRHCTRIGVPGGAPAGARGENEEERFHPDFAWLDRDLKTSTSAESTRDLIRGARLAPFEARGQVFVIADGASLSAEASDALLKAIEEPGLQAPRHFFLLAGSRLDLAATLRSRSLSVYLGAGERPAAASVAEAARRVRAALAGAAAAPGAAALLGFEIAGALVEGKDCFEDPRAASPWRFAASVAREAALPADDPEPALDGALRRRLLDLAAALLSAGALRLRGIAGERILEGLVNEHLVGPRAT
jgi:DNA polymerase-3 subunit delta'